MLYPKIIWLLFWPGAAYPCSLWSSCSSQGPGKSHEFSHLPANPATDLLRPISCAYEFGVPQASGQFHQGDGPYKGGVWDAESNLVYINLAVNWMVLLSTPSGASHMDISGYTLGYNLQPFLLWRCSCHCMDFSILLMEFPSTKTWLWTGEEILSDHVGCVNKARDTAWRRERVMLTTWIERLPLRYRSKKLSEASQHTSELADLQIFYKCLLIYIELIIV